MNSSCFAHLLTLIFLVNGLIKMVNAQHDFLIDETYGDGGEKIINWAVGDITSAGTTDEFDRTIFVCSDYTHTYAHTTVIRLDVDGQFDQSFAVADGFPGAFAYQPDSSFAAFIPQMILGNDGKITVANGIRILQSNGQVHEAVHLFRLNDDGSMDSTFGNDGVVIIEGLSHAHALAADDNGNLYLGAGNYLAPSFQESRIVKIDQHGGVLDLNFAELSLSSITASYESFSFLYLEVLNDQLYVLVNGRQHNSWIDKYIDVFRVYATSGDLDTSFGNNGSFSYPRTIHTTYEYTFRDIVFLENGGLILLLYARYDPSRLIKLTSDGVLDTSFGEEGLLDLDFPSSTCNHFNSFAKHPTNGWYIVSSNDPNVPCGSGTLSIAQLNDLGEPILINEPYGSIEINTYFDNTSLNTSVQSDGKLVVTGFFFNFGPPDLKAIRVNAQLVSDISESSFTGVATSLTAYPNPAANYLRVNLDIPQQAAQNGPVELVMHDLQGRVVYRQNHPELQFSEVSIDVSQFPSGLYTLHCTVNGVWVDGQKVMVE